jgi:1,4-alpha-glucan branching enzyme
MPGDEWQRFANTRAFLSYMYTHPGKKLLFMGSEIGMTAEWNSETDVQWWLLQFDIHRKLQTFCAALNEVYKSQPALYEVDFHYTGFEWIDFHDSENSMVSFIRYPRHRQDFVVVVCNFTPTPHTGYRIGVPEAGEYVEIFNSDAEMFGGSNMGNGGRVMAESTPSHGRPASLSLVIPPLGVLILKPARPVPRPPIESVTKAGAMEA